MWTVRMRIMFYSLIREAFLKSLRPLIFIGIVVVLNQTFYISYILNVYQILLMSYFFFIIFSYHAHGKEVILLEVLYYSKASTLFIDRSVFCHEGSEDFNIFTRKHQWRLGVQIIFMHGKIYNIALCCNIR